MIRFDMLIAVGAPIYLLVHSYHNFHFDRAAFRIVMELAGPSTFERHARMNADPVQVTLFLINLNALRITTELDFCMRIGMNLSFAYRLTRVMDVIEQRREFTRSRRPTQSVSSLSSHLAAQKSVPKWVSIAFLLLSCSIIAYTHACVSWSTAACSPHSQCVAFAQRAVIKSSSCPCVALVDVDKAPKTYNEWVTPLDATETVKALAVSGDLHMLQVINRKLVQWPEELHNCKNMRYMYVFFFAGLG